MRRLILLGHRVTIFSRSSPPSDLPPTVEWLRADFLDQQAINSSLRGADFAYHLVASTVPRDETYDAARELNENVVGTINLISACVQHRLKKLIFASSASVYGIQSLFPIREDAQTNPISAHGIHKLAVEKFLLLSRHRRDLDVSIARISNPYGPGQNIFGRQGIVAILIGNILRGLPIKLTNGGNMIRDFVYIDDVVEALIEMGFRNQIPPILNVGSGVGCSLLEVVHSIEDILHLQLKIETELSTSVDIPSSILDINKTVSAIGYSPSVALDEGLRRTLKAAKLL